jgi:hypothetical protein
MRIKLTAAQAQQAVRGYLAEPGDEGTEAVMIPDCLYRSGCAEGEGQVGAERGRIKG